MRGGGSWRTVGLWCSRAARKVEGEKEGRVTAVPPATWRIECASFYEPQLTMRLIVVVFMAYTW